MTHVLGIITPSKQSRNSQRRSAWPARKPSFMAIATGVVFNYIFQDTKTTNRATIVAGQHYQARKKIEISALPTDYSLPYYDEFECEIPEMWILTLKLPNGCRISVCVQKNIYERYIDDQGRLMLGQTLSIDYQEGRCDGVPRLVETGNGIYRIP